MRLKKFMTGAVCAAMLISGSGIGNLTSYAEEVTEVSVEWESVEPEENTEDVTEAESIESDGDLEETLITVGSLESEAKSFQFDKTYSGDFDDSGKVQRDVYKINIKSDAVVTINAKMYSSDQVYIYLLDEEGESVFEDEIEVNRSVGFSKEDYIVCISEGDYYLCIKNHQGTLLDWSELNIEGRGADSYEVSASVEYIKSTEISPNGNCNNAQKLGSGTQYGMLGHGDNADTYEFEVPNDDVVTFQVKGTPRGNKNPFRVNIINEKGSIIESGKVVYSEELGRYQGTKELTLDKGTYYIQIKREGSGISYQVTYSFDVKIGEDYIEKSFASYDNYYFYIDRNDDVRCVDSNGNPVINDFKCDGTYTYYFQLDGTAMKDRLTYHPDGIHVIYFDSEGHEVFSDFAHVKKSISGDKVDDYCFFNVFGYMYVDVLTYDKSGTVLYYANPYGVLERNGMFFFSETVQWADGTPCVGIAGRRGYAYSDASIEIRD